MTPAGSGARADAGAAVVEFVLVLGVLLLVFLGIAEIAVLLHVRDVVTADAAEGARFEANADASAGSGGPRANHLLDTTLGTGFRAGLNCTSDRAGQTVAVTCAGTISLPFLPINIKISQTAHSLLEAP